MGKDSSGFFQIKWLHWPWNQWADFLSILLRFREDVINLSPALVVINAGTNDVAENTQAYNEDYTFGNIVSMAELAKANKIKVILTSVLPAAALSGEWK